MCSNPGDLIVDFFGGSGTTAAVAMKMGRKFISCEQLDEHVNLICTRLRNVVDGDGTGISGFDDVNWKGGGSFVYCELAIANQKFADRINDAESTAELLTVWNDMQSTGFLSWKISPRVFNDNAGEFSELKLSEQKMFLIECLDKNMLYVPISEIDNAEFEISDTDKRLTSDFYNTLN